MPKKRSILEKMLKKENINNILPNDPNPNSNILNLKHYYCVLKPNFFNFKKIEQYKSYKYGSFKVTMIKVDFDNHKSFTYSLEEFNQLYTIYNDKKAYPKFVIKDLAINLDKAKYRVITTNEKGQNQELFYEKTTFNNYYIYHSNHEQLEIMYKKELLKKQLNELGTISTNKLLAAMSNRKKSGSVLTSNLEFELNTEMLLNYLEVKNLKELKIKYQEEYEELKSKKEYSKTQIIPKLIDVILIKKTKPMSNETLVTYEKEIIEINERENLVEANSQKTDEELIAIYRENIIAIKSFVLKLALQEEILVKKEEEKTNYSKQNEKSNMAENDSGIENYFEEAEASCSKQSKKSSTVDNNSQNEKYFKKAKNESENFNSTWDEQVLRRVF